MIRNKKLEKLFFVNYIDFIKKRKFVEMSFLYFCSILFLVGVFKGCVDYIIIILFVIFYLWLVYYFYGYLVRNIIGKIKFKIRIIFIIKIGL